MSRAMNLVGIILLGIIVLVIVNLMSDVRTTSELDYYLLQELTEASMYDAVDYSYYRDTGLLKIDRDMFLENFARRFSASVTNNRNYDFRIIDFNETPPKVSIEVTTNTVASVNGEVAVLKTQVSGILEYIYDDLVMSRGLGRGEVVDINPPTLEVAVEDNQNKVTMRDDVSLDNYCIAYLPKEELTYDAAKATGGFHCYNDILGEREVVETIPTIVSNEYYGWVIVYDRAGNSSYAPLVDTAPFVKYAEYSADGKNLSIEMYDNENISQYLVMVDSSDSNNTAAYVYGGWINVGKNQKSGNYNKAIVNITNFTSSDSVPVGVHDYYIFAKDNSGQISAPAKLTIRKTIPHPPTITVNYDNFNKALRITFTDSGGDLSRYAITTSSNEPNSGWTNITGNMQQTTIVYGSINNPVQPGTYYIFVRDNEGSRANASITVEAEKKDIELDIGGGRSFCYLYQQNCQSDPSIYIDDCSKYSSADVTVVLNPGGQFYFWNNTIGNAEMNLDIQLKSGNQVLASARLLHLLDAKYWGTGLYYQGLFAGDPTEDNYVKKGDGYSKEVLTGVEKTVTLNFQQCSSGNVNINVGYDPTHNFTGFYSATIKKVVLHEK